MHDAGHRHPARIVKTLIHNIGIALLGAVVPALVVGVALLVLSIKWRHDDCVARGTTPVITDDGRFLCAYPDGTAVAP